MNILDEIRQYSDEDLQLILSTQQDRYSAEELKQIQACLQERRLHKEGLRQEQLRASLPEAVRCEACGTSNPFKNRHCRYCGHMLDKSAYFQRRKEETKEVSDGGEQAGGKAFYHSKTFLILLRHLGLRSALAQCSHEERVRFCMLFAVLALAVIALIVVMVIR